MKKPDESDNKRLVSRTQIARAVFSAAESMGIADRGVVERITAQVIERLERTPAPPGAERPLPGMEELVAIPRRQQKRLPTASEIQTIVEEILASKEMSQREEVKPKMETVRVKSRVKANGKVNLTGNALRVLERRYLKKDAKGQVMEAPEEMFRRVAGAIASAELNYDAKADVKAPEEEFYRLMATLEFLPNSPTLMNAGRELGQLSACFVLPVEDSMESIFDAVKNTALIHKSGGGTGFSFSRLRPESDRVGSTGGVASGPVSFIRAFDIATDVIKQGGMRRGANMGILSVSHPDIMRFITSKDDPTVLTNFNISVAVTGDFMEAVKAGADYDLVNPRTKEVVGKLSAKEVFDKMVAMAWKTGDPGIVFIDRINQDNPTPNLGSIESTNPCGEQPLLPHESCNLGSINLSLMVKGKDGACEIDYPRLAETIKTTVRFLDNVIEVNRFPLPQIEEMTKKSRKIGLGVMGFADMLIKLGIPYNSEAALGVAAEIMEFVTEEAAKASQGLAVERGAFPAFTGSIYDTPGAPGIRNASCTTIAPTGTLSIIAGCSSGIEPLFALSYKRHILDGDEFIEVNPYFEEVAKKEGFYSEELMRNLADGVSLQEIEEVPDNFKRVFVTAHEITPEWHVRMQAAFQRHTHNAVSKTVNFPREATLEDVARVYMLAYEEGVKGITIYRDGSREGQVLTTGKTEKKTEGAVLSPRKRAKTTSGVTERVTTGCGYIYVTVNSDDEGICEVFSTLGKAGGCAQAQLEAICRLISLALRSGVDVASVVRQLRGIRCPSIAWEGGKSILSCADAIASVLEKHTTGYEGKPRAEDYGLVKNLAGQCPDCGNLLVYQEGCFVCPSCGYTKC
ncbi:MAG TPA: vitamin B12-dependent ribonucleotide reductase [Dehalococcoidia bacterium]|nr:vitamin B12-dependent ribonucleotide reductase [Dehalococcoidia bacterium]